MTEGETTGPGYLTEPELIALMDVNGIGTDATMAEHIAKIVERKYVFAQPRGRAPAAPNDDEPPASRGRGRGRGGRGSRGGGRGRGRGGAAAGSGGDGGAGTGGVQEFLPSTLGIALVESYDSMNFSQPHTSLTKPFLRKEMELKMKGICDGRLQRGVVVSESLEMYREMFAVANREVGRLRGCCGRYLGGVEG